MRGGLAPVHPAEILAGEYMVPLGICINRLSRDLHVPLSRISELVNRRDTSPQRDSFG